MCMYKILMNGILEEHAKLKLKAVILYLFIFLSLIGEYKYIKSINCWNNGFNILVTDLELLLVM